MKRPINIPVEITNANALAPIDDAALAVAIAIAVAVAVAPAVPEA